MSLKDDALAYHRADPPGKLEIVATKPMMTPADLSLAYSPGVADACMAIVEDPATVAEMTGRANCVAVISNGTAVLGLGNIGPLAAKPVMEGKAVLFKRFAGINVFDIEIDETDVDAFVETVARLEPTFGGINLEDIKAPQCFEIERRLIERMNIPVFHDDQHGTAIVTAAAITNWLRLSGRRIEDVRLACSGAGAAAIACLDLLVGLGLKQEAILVCDSRGVIHQGRDKDMEPTKARYAAKTNKRTLAEAMQDADIFLGVSAPGLVDGAMVASMAPDPLVLALANPDPEITPELAKAARADVTIATGRSDYPNQVNNVLCFPFLFRGALDVGATTINAEMKAACVDALAALARAEPSDVAAAAYPGETLLFGRDYLVPKPFDPRLVVEVPIAVAKAAMASGAATRPIADFAEYRRRLARHASAGEALTGPVHASSGGPAKRLVYADGEDSRVLGAANLASAEGLASSILVGRSAVIEKSIRDLGLGIRVGDTVRVVDPATDRLAVRLAGRYQATFGLSRAEAERIVRTDRTAFALLMLADEAADAAVCGASSAFGQTVEHLEAIIGTREGIEHLSVLHGLVMPGGTVFIADTGAHGAPSAGAVVQTTQLAIAAIRRFGIEPDIALLAHDGGEVGESPASAVMREAAETLRAGTDGLAVEGPLDAGQISLDRIRRQAINQTGGVRRAPLLVMPSLEAARIALGLLVQLGNGVSVGPIVMGSARPAHVVDAATSVRGVLDISAIAIAEARGQD